MDLLRRADRRLRRLCRAVSFSGPVRRAAAPDLRGEPVKRLDRSKRLARRWQKQWEDVTDIVSNVKARGPEMLALATEARSAPDGYPTRSIGDGTSRSSETMTSTEGAALAGYPEDDPDRHYDTAGQRVNHPGPDARVDHTDLIDEWLAEFFSRGLAVIDNLEAMQKIGRLIENRKDRRVDRNDGNCRACGRYVSGSVRTEDGRKIEDRLRNEFCSACYQALRTWRERQTDPTASVQWFIAERRVWLLIDAEGKMLAGSELTAAIAARDAATPGSQLVAEQLRRAEENSPKRRAQTTSL